MTPVTKFIGIHTHSTGPVSTWGDTRSTVEWSIAYYVDTGVYSPVLDECLTLISATTTDTEVYPTWSAL